ncbi:hypothetical protein L208DRAFT_841704 [Tricholoma matsutake]|nr:hypothetical protein L208DRAFT_841704 [Tricholoma matsutake 945]
MFCTYYSFLSSGESIGDDSDQSVDEEALVFSVHIFWILNLSIFMFPCRIVTPPKKALHHKATTPPVTPTPKKLTWCN